MIQTINYFLNCGPVVQDCFDAVARPWKGKYLQEMENLSDQWLLEYVSPGPEEGRVFPVL